MPLRVFACHSLVFHGERMIRAMVLAVGLSLIAIARMAVLASPLPPTLLDDAACVGLSKLALPNTTITTAEVIAAGACLPPGAGAGATSPAMATLPAFCRVAATLKPSADSDIKIEVWLPASGWNDKFQAVGNGGWAGTISYPAMAQAVAHGYATSSTDTGHTGGSASFALGHPEK